MCLPHNIFPEFQVSVYLQEFLNENVFKFQIWKVLWQEE